MCILAPVKKEKQMTAGKKLNTANVLYSNIARALSGDEDSPYMVALAGGVDTAFQPIHQAISTVEPTATWTAVQGIARNATNWFAIDTSEIRKYDLNSNLLVTNSAPFSGLPVGLDHCGDGFVDGNYLYIALSNYSSGVSTKKVIAKYLITTLMLDSYFDLVAQTDLNASGCCLDKTGTEILVTSYYSVAGNDPRNTDIYRFDKTTGAFLGIHTLSVPSVGIQSITYHSDGRYYLGSFGAQNLNTIYAYDGSFTFLTSRDPTGSEGEMEGVESFEGVLYFNTINSSPRVLNLENLYISSDESKSSPVQFLDEALLSDNVTLLIRMTPNTVYNYNAILDNQTYTNDWESWIYSDGRVAFRVDSANSIISAAGVGQASVEMLFGATWSNSGGTVATKLNIDGNPIGSNSGTWKTPPTNGIWLAGINEANDQGDNTYKDILVFNKVLSDEELLDAYNNFDDFYVIKGLTPKTTNNNVIKQLMSDIIMTIM